MKTQKQLLRLFGLLIIVGLMSCSSEKEEESSTETTNQLTSNVKHPAWSKDAVIYEVNIRQHTEAGTFKAFEKDIPRLKALGIDILWLMPIHPVGEENRKGTLGSYYAVKDYKAINPEFGTAADFRSLIKTAHENDMKLIIDWVANHTAWDHVWTTEHVDWYNLTADGGFQPPVADWADVIDLNYDN